MPPAGPSAPGAVMQRRLDDVYQHLLADRSGEPATYIPELGKVDPDQFGIAVVTADGQCYSVGDARSPFTIQSISKAFTYGLALEDHGAAAVLNRIGVEPSGEAFNSIVMDEAHNRPMNPLVNAGAIACAALVKGRDLEERRARIMQALSRHAGRPLTVDGAVFESERATGHRNRAIAYLELSSGMVDEPVSDHLELYFTQCSVLVTAVDLATMAATLANGGVNPVTGERALAATHVPHVLSVMSTCGMYDWSGEWMFRVGLPAKSGVGGGILAILPGQLGIGTFSPRLDPVGNSVRGVAACERLAQDFSLHLCEVAGAAGSVVRRRYDAAAVSSKRLRGPREREHLAQEGGAVAVFELQGDLFFATAERLVREVEARDPAVRVVLLDLRRVHRANRSALSLLGHLCRDVADAGGQVGFAACTADIRADLSAADPGVGDGHFWPNIDLALEASEDRLLGAPGAVDGRGDDLRGPEGIDVLNTLGPDELAAILPLLREVRYQAGERIIRRGDSADRIYFLAAGRASASVPGSESESAPTRIESLSAGVAFGESAFFEGGERVADVVADEPVTCLELPIQDLRAVAEEHPALLAKLLVGVGANLSRFLFRATEQIRALEA